MKQTKIAKVMAILALAWIIISVIWTWLLVIFDNSNNQQQVDLTPEQIEEIQNMINSQTWTTQSSSWEINIESSLSWQTIETN